MPRTAKPTKPAEDKQPSLFSASQLPNLPNLVAAAKRFIHTGKIVSKDEERAAAIAQAFLECGLVLPVCRRFHCSPNTVHAVIEVYEREGKLDDLKQRVSRKLGLLAEVSAEAAIELVSQGKCPANVLPINVGVSLEKKAMVDGEATSRVEVLAAAPIGTQDVIDYCRAHGLPVPSIDVEATVSAPKPQ